MKSLPMLINNAVRCDAKYTHVLIGESSRGQRHNGYTILEMLIASGIMFVLAALLLSAWASSTDFAFMVNENLRRMEAVDRISSTLRDDFENSAALDQYNETNKVAQIDSLGKTITLYPQILQTGREIRFVRLRSTITAASDPSAEEPYRENFAQTNVQTLSQFNNAPVTPFFIISPDAETPGGWALSPVWESNLSGLSFNQNANPQFLRLYRLVLVPYSSVVPVTMDFYATPTPTPPSDFPFYPEAGPGLRRGMLLRQYSNTTLANTAPSSTVASGRVWNTLGLPLSDAVVFNESAPDMFTSYYDGTSSSSADAVRDNEIRMKLSLGMQVQNLNATVVTLDLRLSLPFRRVTHGQ
jgi:type II secretory pathway pseudopilin PulG